MSDFNYVGIALARSVEGDALAEAMEEVDGVEVIRQPSFNEVRARERLRLDFDELTDACGFDVDSNVVQVLMSTYYGRLINTDDALLLFHDPIEASQHM